MMSLSLLSVQFDGLIESSIEGIPVFVAVALPTLLGVHEDAALAILRYLLFVEENR